MNEAVGLDGWGGAIVQLPPLLILLTPKGPL